MMKMLLHPVRRRRCRPSVRPGSQPKKTKTHWLTKVNTADIYMETDTQPELNKYFILYFPRKTLELVFTVCR